MLPFPHSKQAVSLGVFMREILADSREKSKAQEGPLLPSLPLGKT
jgi:hypothetical protein